jgi:hypothetical protein
MMPDKNSQSWDSIYKMPPPVSLAFEVVLFVCLILLVSVVVESGMLVVFLNCLNFAIDTWYFSSIHMNTPAKY